MRTVGIGVVGLGAVSQFYLAALERIPSLHLAGVCDLDTTLLGRFRGTVACYCDHRDLIQDPEVQAVVVTVPNDAHVGVCMDAVAAGVAVCVEKPLSTRLEQAEALLKFAHAAEVPVMTAFHRRYNRSVVQLAEMVIGQRRISSLRVRYLERIEDHLGSDAWYLDPDRCGGGCVADNGPNAFDLARLFLGELEVTDVAIGRDHTGMDRQAHIVLTAACGANARVELDWSYDGECKQVEVRLEDGSFYAIDMLAGHAGFKGSLWHEYVGVLTHFDAVMASTAPYLDGGLPALALVDSTYRAEQLGPVPSSSPASRADGSKS